MSGDTRPSGETQRTTSRKTILVPSGNFFFLFHFVFNSAAPFTGGWGKKKRLRRWAKAASSPYHIVANLGLAVDDSLLSADQTVQASHGGACEEEKKRQSVTTAERRQRNRTGAGGDGGDGGRAPCGAGAAPRQQSSFFPSAQREGLSKPA